MKMNEQQKAQRAEGGREEGQDDQNDRVEYAKLIQTLETKRGHLIGQKIQLERKIQDLHEAQRKQAQEEAQNKLDLDGERERSRFKVEK